MIHARNDYNRIQDPLPAVEGGIGETEPVFLIRAKDVTAADAVEHWARLAEAAGADPNIVDTARSHVDVIRQWQAANGTQVPDMPAAERRET